MANDSQIQEAQLQYRRVIELQKAGIALYLELGKTLYKIREEKLYLYMGNGGFDTYRDFLDNPEISFSEPAAYEYTSVYEFYCLKHGYQLEDLQDFPLNRLKRLIPLLKNEQEPEKVKQQIESVRGQTSRDFEASISPIAPDKPQVYIDKESLKWVIKFKPETTLEIINITNGENILQPVPDDDQSE
jgi:hypothetical protein